MNSSGTDSKRFVHIVGVYTHTYTHSTRVCYEFEAISFKTSPIA